MANILMITNSIESASTDISDFLVSDFGHSVVTILQSQAESDYSLLLGYDVIVCPRLSVSTDSASALLSAINSGIPVISGTYINTAEDPTSYSSNVLEINQGFTENIFNSVTNNRTTLNINISGKCFFEDYTSQENLLQKENIKFSVCQSPTWQYGYSAINQPSAWVGEDGKAMLMINEIGSTKHIAYGGLYGRTIFTYFGKYIINKLITLAISEEPEGLFISGKITLEDQPHTSKVVVTSANENPSVLGYGKSDINGDYSINVGEYNGPVLIHTMQDYGLPWSASTAKVIGDAVHPTIPNGYIYKATKAGNTGTAEPIWTAEENVSINDGSVIYQPERLLKPEIEGYVTPTTIA